MYNDLRDVPSRLKLRAKANNTNVNNKDIIKITLEGNITVVQQGLAGRFVLSINKIVPIEKLCIEYLFNN